MRKPLILLIAVLAIIGGIWWIVDTKASAPASRSVHTASSSTVSQSFNKQLYSLISPASIWVIVNKQHPLQPIDYAPTDLRTPTIPSHTASPDQAKLGAETATALEQLYAAANQASIHLVLQSGYRSYTYQQSLYSGYVSSAGQGAADQESARPGYSEHQTGLALDFSSADNKCTLEACFGTTPEGQWLATNAYQYGFILRYPADKVTVTGYEYEPWHFRYVGKDLSLEMHNTHIETLEEFFDVPGGSTYK